MEDKRGREKTDSDSDGKYEVEDEVKDSATPPAPAGLAVTRLHRALSDRSGKESKWRWTVSYCKKGLLTRLKVELTEDKKSFMSGWNNIKAVKFFSRKNESDSVEVEEYKCDVCYRDISSMIADVATSASPHLRKDVTHINPDSPLWKNVGKMLDDLGMRYVTDSALDGEIGWQASKAAPRDSNTSDTSDDKAGSEDKAGSANEDADKLVSAFRHALETDMMNGEAEFFFKELTWAVMETLGYPNWLIRFECPRLYSRCDTKMEVVAVEDETNWNRAYSTEPPEPKLLPYDADADANADEKDYPPWATNPGKKLPVQKASLVVPAVTWALPGFPGHFPLVVEMKPEKHMLGAVTQCYREMLSRLFFQKSIFGLVLTPRHYVLLFAQKVLDKKIELVVSKLDDYGYEKDHKVLSTEKFFMIAEILCKIMDWAGRQSGYCK